MKIHRGFGPFFSSVVVSLCDYSGNWPRPYIEAGYTVLQYDLKHADDVTVLHPEGIFADAMRVVYSRGVMPVIVGVMAAPPCTHFTIACNRLWAEKDADGRTEADLRVVDACFWLATGLGRRWWVLENAVGRLRSLRPALGKPRYFHPHNYAGYLGVDEFERELYTKKTALFGNFVMPPHYDIKPRTTGNNTWITKLGGKSERTKELRSMTPMGFATAFHRGESVNRG